MRAYSKNIKKYRRKKSNKRVKNQRSVRRLSKKRVGNRRSKNMRRKNYKKSRRSRRQRGGYTQPSPTVQESCEPSTAESNKQAFFNSFTETNQSDNNSSSQRVCDYVGENSSGTVAYSCV